MRYDFMVACCARSMDFQEQLDIARWEDDGGAPARHYHAGRTDVEASAAAAQADSTACCTGEAISAA